jgi:lipopolysaccharide transport system ATP-binding protein
MSDIAIRVENLGKRYRLGKRERYRTLRDTLTDLVTAPFRRLRSGPSPDAPAETIWALKEVSFDVKQGEVIGIIGRNGAGKSTLLKILSRITEPTEGHATIHGRVGSLLEVGTGFHTELTGRENIFLNGAILGMRRTEILRKFDEIVAFAEVEKFIDTPVKHYSSGMYMRLAFAVAAHLDPEILIVDEVLAVGDLNFQKKCLGKMGDAAKAGRTVILVTHQLNQIRRLCNRCMWLEAGGLRRAVAPAAEVVSAYEADASAGPKKERGTTNAGARFISWAAVDPINGGQSHTVSDFGPMTVTFKVEVNRPLRSGSHGIALYSAADQQLLWGNGYPSLELQPGDHDFTYTFDTLPLKPGAYQWLMRLYDESGVVDSWEALPYMTVATAPQNRALDEWSGVLNMPFAVTISQSRSRSCPERQDATALVFG